MPTYAVAVSRVETATVHVEADNAATAERIALSEAESSSWESETLDVQVDDTAELDEVSARRVSSTTVREAS